MADVKQSINPLFLREEDLREGMELLFFAYRDLIARPDEQLRSYGFGRAHHRVVFFVGRYPMLSVSQLLDILGITKQSLSRVLQQLVDQGYIVQHQGRNDRRQRLLELTDKGWQLERELTEDQRARFTRAYKAAGGEAVDGFRKVLLGMVNESDRARLSEHRRPGDASKTSRGKGS